ncbi:MAG TPA: T9SS type A sorting domain-containing protein [Bacteroidales bacterium]|nr:T9SS type A sorting domain-containing protein [Bacteroidales bacterium]HSA42812.1 T9SS type A sorting domain-containing protein [Bacteroidales bacterium]
MKTTLTKMMALFTAIFMLSSVAFSQEIITTATTVGVCPGVTTVQVPITVQNFAGVASISLSMIINTSQITYASYVAHPILAGAGGFLIVNNPGNKVKFAYFGINPISIPDNAALFTVTFNVVGSSPMTWDLATQGECQYSDFMGMPLPALFISGAVNVTLPDADFTSTPTVCENDPATVTVDFTAGTAPFTIVYNDGVNPDVTVVTSDDPYEFTQTINTTTTWTLVSIADASCSNPTVNKTTTTQVIPDPSAFNVGGGGSACEGEAGLTVTLDGSQAGMTYQLLLDGNPTAYSLSGTGDPLSFMNLTDGGLYTILVQSECGDLLMTGSATVEIFPLPAVTLAPFSPVCEQTPAFLLTGGLPEGGAYSGIGVDNGMFYSEVTGTGDFLITYTYTDGNGCTNAASEYLTVVAIPTVAFNPVDPMCADAAPVALYAAPEGGMFSGTGVVGNTFDPSVSGAGSFMITYDYTDAFGCSNSASIEIVVYAVPVVSIEPLTSVCADAGPVFLTGIPAGGFFDGPGVQGEYFYPSWVGAGTWTITYHYYDQNNCYASASTDITVFPLPEPMIDPIGPYCIDAPAVTLMASPPGGLFSGIGVMNDMFIPALAGAGWSTVTYTITDLNGCTNFAQTDVLVNDLPQVYLAPLGPLCINDNLQELYGYPEGGMFDGPGISGNYFDPAVAGVGTFVITYSYTDPQGCSNSSTQEVIVNDIPSLSFTLPASVCENTDPFDMMPEPQGGYFDGPGAYGSYFYPSDAGAGTWDITYHFTDGNNCHAMLTQTITVNPIPVVTLEPVGPLCIDAAPVTLAGSPEGGNYSGQGVMDNVFYPAIAGEGAHYVTYTYTDPAGCSNAAFIEVIVNGLPNVYFDLYPVFCIDAAPVQAVGYPDGGVFSGNGMDNGFFNPMLAGAGEHTITYTYTDGNGCTNSTSSIVTVYDLPVVSFNLPEYTCINADPVFLEGSPSGGYFVGTGVMGDWFYPADAGLGMWDIYYVYIDPNGCSNNIGHSITVNALPQIDFPAIASLCENSAPVNLMANPAGGVFSGDGVVGEMFDPALVGPGYWTITYTYTDAFGCTNAASIEVAVYSLPSVSVYTQQTICYGPETAVLVGYPEGGVFSGDGVIGNMFHPLDVEPGDFVITYTYTDEHGCTNSAQTIITVLDIPDIIFPPLPDICLNNGPLALYAEPEGGTFVGDGVVGNTFDPSITGPGIFQIFYEYTGPNGCSNFYFRDLQVFPLPEVSFDLVSGTCLDADPIALTGLPEGGTFSGTGVDNNVFYPALAGIGIFDITYTYTDLLGCTNSVTHTITVDDAIQVIFNPIPDLCIDADPVSLYAMPEGGVFSGPGVVGNMFYPAQAGVGSWDIVYTYVSSYNCQGNGIQTVNVYPLPEVSLDPIAPLCIDAAPVTLNGMPEGGVFAGPGVDGNMFHPDWAGAGTWTVSYTYVNAFECSATAMIDITVYDLPLIIDQPADITVDNNDPAWFFVNASNVTAYQWQLSTDGGMTWDDLSEGGIYAGTTGGQLAINPATLPMDGYMYRCVLWSECNNPVISDAAVLHVLLTEITIIAGNAEACEGQVIIPVNAENFYDVAAMSLALEFDAAVLNYNTYQNVNPAFDNGLMSVNVVGNLVKIGFFTVVPASFGNGTIMELVFDGVAGATALTWDLLTPGNCELLNIDEDLLVTNYINGNATINALPAVFDMTGGGVYCYGTNGVEIGLNGSETGVTYYLNHGGLYIASVEGNGQAISFGFFAGPGTYNVYAFNSVTTCMSDMNGTVEVTMNDELIVDAGADVNIFIGGSTQLQAVITGGTGPYTYEWTPVAFLDDPYSLTPNANPVSTQVYTFTATDFYGCTASDEVTVFVEIPQDNIVGTLTYMNASNTPMNDASVMLKDPLGNVVATTTANADGSFLFTGIGLGTYTLDAATTKPWGGGNAADGLLMLKHFVGQQMLTGLPLVAGDVTGNGVVNAHDALNTLRRFVNLLPDYAPQPDWVFENPVVNVDYVLAPVVDFHALCMSDVNMDYIPGFKMAPGVEQLTYGSVSPLNGMITLPIYAAQSLNLGAVSMVINLPEGYLTQSVNMAATGGELLFNQTGNELRIGWFNLEPLAVNPDDLLLQITLKTPAVVEETTIQFNSGSVLSNESAQTIPAAGLIVPKISPADMQNSLNSYPNPVLTTARIQYTLAEDGHVKIRLFNILGEKIALLVNADETAGEHVINLDVSTLSQGNYLLKMETGKQVMNKMITINK